MFNKHYHIERGGGHHTHTHNHKVTVNEHRAPTDESIRIYEEMLRKAQENIIAKFPVEVLGVSGTAIAFHQDMTSYHRKVNVFIKFSINGKEHIIRGETDFEEALNSGEAAYLDSIGSLQEAATRVLVAPYIARWITEYILNYDAAESGRKPPYPKTY